MAERSIESIKKAVILEYKRLVPDEPVYSRAFSLYLLDRYVRLLYRLYLKSEKKG